MNAARSSRNRVGRGNSQRRLDASSKSSNPKQLDNSFTGLAVSRTHSFEDLKGKSNTSEKLEICHEWANDAPDSGKQPRAAKKIRGRKPKTIGDMFVEDEFEAISFGADDFTTTSATTATTKSSAAKIVPVKVETTVDMDPFANIDNGFSDWNYGGKQNQMSPEKGKERRSRRRSSMSNVPMNLGSKFEAPKVEPTEDRRRSRRSSLDMTLATESAPPKRRGDPSISSGVSARSNGSRSNSSSENKGRSRKEGDRDGKGRSDRKQRQSRRRASMGVKIESSVDCYPQEEAVQAPVVRRGTARRASLSMVAGTTSSVNNNDPPRRSRRASMKAGRESFPVGFATDQSFEKKAQEWDESGFKVIK